MYLSIVSVLSPEFGHNKSTPKQRAVVKQILRTMCANALYGVEPLSRQTIKHTPNGRTESDSADRILDKVTVYYHTLLKAVAERVVNFDAILFAGFETRHGLTELLLPVILVIVKHPHV